LLVLTALTLLVALGIGGLIGREPQSRARKASRFVAPTGSDAERCTRTAPCRTFARAYAVARPGEIVEVVRGSYPEQTIDERPSPTRDRRHVVFRPAEKGEVEIPKLTVRGSDVAFRDMRVATWSTYETAANVRFVNIVNRGFWIFGSSDVAVYGGSVGPGVDLHPIIAADWNASRPPAGIVVDRVLFHGWTRSNADVHTECLQIGGGNGITIRRSRFVDCAVMGIHVTHWGSSPPTRNVTIENNVFAAPIDGGHYALLAGAYDGLLIRNNSALAPVAVDPSYGHSTNVRLISNVAPMRAWQCAPRINYSHNAWQGARCGPTDRNTAGDFRDAVSLDLRLRHDSDAIDSGDPNSYPQTDIDGKARPRGDAPDAGAYESG